MMFFANGVVTVCGDSKLRELPIASFEEEYHTLFWGVDVISFLFGGGRISPTMLFTIGFEPLTFNF